MNTDMAYVFGRSVIDNRQGMFAISVVDGGHCNLL